MKAVTNAGPLIALGKLGLMPLLSHLFDTILGRPMLLWQPRHSRSPVVGIQLPCARATTPQQAQKLGFHVKGTLGIIVDAFRRRLLTTEEVELIFQAILDRDDIWISRRAGPPRVGCLAARSARSLAIRTNTPFDSFCPQRRRPAG